MIHRAQLCRAGGVQVRIIRGMRRLLAALVVLSVPGSASVDRAIDQIAARPEYAHAAIGVEAIDLSTGKTVYAHDANRFFVPGSTTKLLTVGSALEAFGPDHRFHTRVYRTGEIDGTGTLWGDVVLVASGDPNLSNRARPDGTLAFEDEDHSYGGPNVHPVPGDPLTVIQDLARQVAAHGIKRVTGRVRVDVSLFPEGEKEGGTGVHISPIVVNDNVVDLMAETGDSGQPVKVTTQPLTSYVRFVNHLTTGAAGAQPSFDIASDEESDDGSRTVTLTGALPPKSAGLASYAVASPSRFAAVVLAEALNAHGVVASVAPRNETADFGALRGRYDDPHLVAEHVSLPMAEAAKVILKVSQNLHASMMPYVVGATTAQGPPDQAIQRGFDRMKKWLDGSGLDVSGASQADGAGAAAHYTPHFMAGYLAWMTKQPAADVFRHALPIMGRDGTLAEIQVKSPAAGHVFAKTGTYGEEDRLHHGLMVDGKGLAGYIDTAAGHRLAFAAYINFARFGAADDGTKKAGEALGEIATALYSQY